MCFQKTLPQYQNDPIHVLELIGNLHLLLNNTSKGLNLLNKSLAVRREYQLGIGDIEVDETSLSTAKLASNVGRLFFKEGLYNDAIKPLKLAIDIRGKVDTNLEDEDFNLDFECLVRSSLFAFNLHNFMIFLELMMVVPVIDMTSFNFRRVMVFDLLVLDLVLFLCLMCLNIYLLYLHDYVYHVYRRLQSLTKLAGKHSYNPPSENAVFS